MDNVRTLLPLALGAALAGSPSVVAETRFNSSEIEGPGTEILACDLNGDSLKELVLMDGLDLFIFHQESKRGFSREPQQHYRLEDRPAVMWPARVGGRAECLLVMTSEGLTALDFTNRTGPPVRRQIITQPTLIPDVLDETRVERFPLLARTDGDWPLLLVPAAGGLQVWHHRDEWRPVQFIEEAVKTQIIPTMRNPGYARIVGFNLGVGDINGDRRDDLTIRRRDGTGTETYSIYLQKADDAFALEPALRYTNQPDWHSWLCWADLNHDGNVDLIKSTWLEEPSFLPGIPSGRVLAGIYPADEHGTLPLEPQRVFRKNDWTAALPVLDLDGDDFLDLALGYCRFDKEGLRKQVTAKQLDFNLKFFFYRPDAGYPGASDCQRDLAIHLVQPALAFGWRRGEFFTRFVNLSGDFNGDGKRDLLVRDHSDRVSIYFFVSREQGFSRKADLRFDCPEPIERLEVSDLNEDGTSDLIVRLQDRDVFRVFTSDGR